jgi:hypothetical protein
MAALGQPAREFPRRAVMAGADAGSPISSLARNPGHG